MLAPRSSLHQFVGFTVPTYPSVTGLHQGVSASSVGWFVYALVWALALLVAFTGWGRFSGRLFRVQRLPVSVSCSLGIAIIIFVGGILNVFHAIYSSTLFALVAIGLLLYILQRKMRPENYRWRDCWEQAPRFARLLLIAALIILALKVAATIRLSSFDATDDGSAYLSFPDTMLAYHQFATGPFNDRHIISSVGGGYWLQAFIISATSLANIGMADRTFGLLLLFAALFDLGIAFELSAAQIALVEFLAFLVPQPTANLTFVILPISLLLSLLWFVYQTTAAEERHRWRYALLAGGIGGAAVALKSTFLPCVGSFCLIPYLVVNWRRKKGCLEFPIMAGVGAIIVLAAWMFALKSTGGTYLYPVLGHGFDSSKLGVFGSFTLAKTPRTIVKLFVQALVLLVLAFAAFRVDPKNTRVLFAISVMIGAAVGITAFNLASGGDSIWRYGFPQFFSAVLVYSIIMLSASREARRSRRKHLALALAILPIIGSIFYFDFSGARPHLFREVVEDSRSYGPALRASLSDQQLSATSLKAEYHAVENAIPGSGISLESVAYPFLLNYKAHRIFMMDWSGAAGPPPGWPFGQDAAALAQYLRGNSVQYVLYDKQFARWFDARSCQVLENPQRYSTELYVLFWMSLLSHNQLDHLYGSYQSIYNDGSIEVIDLDRPIANTLAEAPVWTVKTDKNQMCAAVAASYRASARSAEAK